MGAWSTLRALLIPAAFIFACLCSLANAADQGMTVLPSKSLDGKVYSARFSAGLSLDNGQSFRATANTNDNLLIRASITPDPAHVGMTGDIFIVENIGNSFFMRTSSGIFVPWSFKPAELVPALENVTLTSTLVIDAYKGKIATAGTHAIFVAYLPGDGRSLVYTSAPLTFNVAGAVDVLSHFEDALFDNMVLKRCVLCHVKGGIADGRTELIFINDSNLSWENFDIFKAFFGKKPDAYNYILSKVSGGNGHAGGIQLPLGSSDYKSMADFLVMLEGGGGGGGIATPDSVAMFFTGVNFQNNTKTLRRAAMLLAGRAPTVEEQSAVASGHYQTLRTVLRNLMQGENFHAFLKDAANDRLLIRGIPIFNPLAECPQCFPAFSSKYTELERMGMTTGKTAVVRQYATGLDYNMRESALELIASVVEKDKPYSEILTADYVMMNPYMNQAAQGTASFASDKPAEFQPGKILGYYRQDESMKREPQPGFTFQKVVDPGNLRTSYPHTGILNDLGFLARYPSTTTNRNRARARWTFYNFLGVDIEQSAQRTTDPAALTDTNNPTLNNPSCMVCHEIMDPVAGAFQDFGFGGFYKIRLGGLDSLDNIYVNQKNAGALYQPGDTWYRDMRVPGFNQLVAPQSPGSLRWLANHIVTDKRFATATVRFWWPAIIGRELLKPPEVATDSDYLPMLSAYEAQEATINSLATGFVDSGFNVKVLLTDLLLSAWFRAETIDPAKVNSVQMRSHQLAGLGNERLLTPEQLGRKTQMLTGFNWNGNEDLVLGFTNTGLENAYRLLYGGIDSEGVVSRTRVITPLMSAVAQTHALESVCPIVMAEFILSDAQRKLFNGIDESITPSTAHGALLIRNKLVQLHQLLLGQAVAGDSLEINALYDLLLQTWEAKRNSTLNKNLYQADNSCNEWSTDPDYADYVGYPGQARILLTSAEGYQRYHYDFANINSWLHAMATDPFYMKQTWVVIMTYYMTHYNYLYE